MSDAEDSVPDRATETEATGETVGEAKWAAVRELERRFPGLDKAAIEFVVVSEGERGLLGVGFVPARVIARIAEAPPERPVDGAKAPASGPVAVLGDLLEHLRRALALDVHISVREEGDSLVAAFQGRELGLVIGKHGQTIDAIQYLANAVVNRNSAEHVDVVVDAAGYRERRRATLESLADRTAARVAASGRAEPLEPMSATERKVVHLRLKERTDVSTSSEGSEPSRHVVISPAE